VIRPEVTARHAVALAAVGRLLVTRAVKPVYLGGGLGQTRFRDFVPRVRRAMRRYLAMVSRCDGVKRNF